MVIAFIFLLHILLIIYILYNRIKSDSKSSAIIDLIFIIIVFSVGWSLSTMFCKLFWDPIGFGKYFDRDTISLTLLTIVEYFFFKFYFKDVLTIASEKEKQ